MGLRHPLGGGGVKEEGKGAYVWGNMTSMKNLGGIKYGGG